MQGGGGSSSMPTFDSSSVTNNQVKANVNTLNNSMLANLTNQVTPFGNLTYNQSGGAYDYYGNFVPSYTATTTLSPEAQAYANQLLGNASQQASLDSSRIGTSQQISDYAKSLFPGLQSALGQPIPSSDKIRDDAYNALMARTNTELDRQTAATKNESANSGIAAGSEAYNRALQPINQSRVDASNQATINASQLANQDLSRYLTLRELPLNEFLTLFNAGGGTGATGPTSPNFVNTPQVQGQSPDVTSAPMAAYNAQMQAYNTAQTNAARQSSALMGGLFGLAGTLGGGLLSSGMGSSLFGLGGSIPTPASQGISVGSVGGMPASYYRTG